MTITINGSGTITGATTLASPVSLSGNATLGGASVKLLNNSGNPVVQQTGSVLQVVTAIKDTATSTTSTSFVAASLTLSITPTSSTSKILIMVSGVAYAGSGGESMITVYRNATTNLGLTNGFQKATAGNSQAIGFQYLDSPATTSTTSYDVYLKASSGATAYFGESLYRSCITLMEIAG